MSRQILILGGGVGGLVTANELRDRLDSQHRVTLVDREPSFVFASSFLWMLIGERTAAKISRPLARLQKEGIDVVRGEIQRIDPERQEALVDGRTLASDFMVIALGAELAPETIPGLQGTGHNFYTLRCDESFRDALASFTRGRIVILTAAPAYKCPAAPYEAAMLVEHACRKRKIREGAQIDLYAAEPGPMGVMGPDVSKAVRAMVEQKGIGYHPEHQVVSVDPDRRQVKFQNGAEAPFDLLAYVPQHRAPRVVRESGLTGASGWIEVDRRTLETRWPFVYALGDVVSIPLALGKPLPKAGVFAHREAEIVARNITRLVAGGEEVASFDGSGECFVETGDGKAAFGKGSFYAEPVPRVRMHPPARHWHAAKVLVEKDWLHRWF